AYAADDFSGPLVAGIGSTIQIAGGGRVASVRANVAISSDGARATVRVLSPDGRHHDLPLSAGTPLVDVELPFAGAPAAGHWRLEVGVRHGSGQPGLGTLRIRTDF